VSGQASLSTQAFKQKVRCLGVIAWQSDGAVAPPDDPALPAFRGVFFGSGDYTDCAPCSALISASLVSRTNSVPITNVIKATMIGYQSPA